MYSNKKLFIRKVFKYKKYLTYRYLFKYFYKYFGLSIGNNNFQPSIRYDVSCFEFIYYYIIDQHLYIGI